ncbi:uncharacterized protein LOC122923175 [Bufo gargarizans]|uniref:uncharacterized protein LOC122923175 n=1 Tax=Bufo gargarizans TaxID=30331 RepID=UPI001CF29891|nr:uncharacterized protein LOC122923175 [Bufo gargarizans]
MGNSNVAGQSEKMLTAAQLMREREGKVSVTKLKSFMQAIGMHETGRLNESLWKNILQEKKGWLRDNNRLVQAELWWKLSADVTDGKLKEIEKNGQYWYSKMEDLDVIRNKEQDSLPCGIPSPTTSVESMGYPTSMLDMRNLMHPVSPIIPSPPNPPRPNISYRTPRYLTPGAAPLRGPNDIPDEPVYRPWSPSEMLAMMSRIPNPEDLPMPFCRELAKIRKAFSCCWRDLEDLVQCKAGDSFSQIIASAVGSYEGDDTTLLSDKAVENFHTLKLVISSTPALGLPDYNKDFRLYCTECLGHASAVLTQARAGQQRPVAYYSARLDPVARGAPSCVRAVVAVQLMLDKSSEIVLNYPITVFVPHDISAILTQVQPKHLSTARHLRLECALLMPPNVTIKRCTTLNPATLLPLEGGGSSGMSHLAEYLPDLEDKHDCLQLMSQETAGFDHVVDTPLGNPDLELFVDGSRYGVQGKFYTGYAVVTQHDTIKAESLPSHKSAQEAELKALEEACRYAEGKTANIYTDSRYAFGITHDYGREIMGALGIEQAFHTAYHPQSSGRVERLNGTIKSKIQKAMAELKKPWTECLPLALFSIRYTPNRKTGLSPYEVLFGNAPRLGLYFPQQLQMQHNSLSKYVICLTNRLSNVYSQVFASLPDPDSIEATHSLQPGDWVVVKRHVRKVLEPRFEGPHQVLLTTATAVKLEGKPNWVHASHCKKVPEPQVLE